MSYLNFDRAIMINLQESLQKEILRTNKSGAYHCSTIVDCNTRKYHGLLVLPIPEIDEDDHVLLSSLDETVIQHGAEFNLGLHKYEGDNFSPKGHKYIREYSCDKIPRTVYRVGGVILSKEKVFVHHENRILIRYTLIDAHSTTKLRLRPFLAFRSVNAYSHQNNNIITEYTQIDNGISTKLYPQYPLLFMQISKKNEFKSLPYWYNGIEYPKEQERGYEFKEDLYSPGYFEFNIKKGESIIFAAGTECMATRTLKQTFDAETEKRIPRNSFHNCLINAGQQFLNIIDGKHYIIAGYPWFKCRARDQFIALPGLTLATNKKDEFDAIMKTSEESIRQFMNGEKITNKIYELEQPDVLLWVIWALQQYAKYTNHKTCKEKYGELIKDIIEFIRLGKHDNLFVHDNGLIYSDGKDKAITWMNATINGLPVTPRTGYIVEFNALWYNDLMFAVNLFNEGEINAEYSSTWEELAKHTADSFKSTFLNEYGYLLDYVDGKMMDWSVRPNMIFTVAFDYSPLNIKEKKTVLDTVTKELLTPKGIRTLSPKSGGYNPIYTGNEDQRNRAYHQGTAWPWLIGFYLEAYLKIYKMSGISFAERTLIGFDSDMTQLCISTLSELYDGNPPFIGHGAVSFAMNIAEMLRITKILTKMTYKKEEDNS